MLNRAALLLLATLCCANTFAQQPEQLLQELLETETVYPQQRGETQVTIGARFEKADDASATVLPMSLEYGITSRFQVGLEWDTAQWLRADETASPARGIGDIELATKLSFLRMRGSHFHSALAMHLLFPSGDSAAGLGEGRVAFEPAFILAKDFPSFHRMQAFTEMGMGIPIKAQKDDTAEKEAIWKVGFFLPYRQVRFVMEADSRSTFRDGMEWRTAPGLVWKAPRGFEVATGWSRSVTSTDEWGLIFKLTREFGGKEEE